MCDPPPLDDGMKELLYWVPASRKECGMKALLQLTLEGFDAPVAIPCMYLLCSALVPSLA